MGKGVTCPSCGGSTPLPDDLRVATFDCTFCRTTLRTADFAGEGGVSAEGIARHLEGQLSTFDASKAKLWCTEAQGRIARYWRPYHAALQGLLDQAHARFGEAILVDCHSMPHEAMDGMARGKARRPEIVLGDRFGAAASSEVVDRIEAAFAGAGLEVTRNAPFAGAFVAQAYGRPSRRQHAVQIEIDRALYMDERSIRPSAGFDGFRQLMAGVVAEIAAIGSARMPLAAE